ncbi:PREDICTED: uncharacterized protein LOC109475066 [Branchiostoma belcheri]|uniref:Uncharacterized protein LOC109475066 n=1 Tax=Branchiostoma belcheri TaxID=7741 RepID=A0A6P4ZNF4_BRABE|nr:PREDICTED: uncharacterized protein LOC109475066 [Branchiostoma belcheri]
MSFDFKAWSDTSKLTSTTIKALEDADLADEDLALSCVTPAILQQLKLTVGQYALLYTGDLLAGATQATQVQASDDNPSVKPGHILDSEPSLDTDIQRFRSGVYAESTKSTYRSQQRAYLRFCIYHKYVPVPATSKNICRYAVFLARTLKFSSIVGYLNIIRIFHQEAGYENPLQDNWLLQTTLRGIRRHHGDSDQQKLPITPSILRAIHNKLDFSWAYHVVFWAACGVAFFSFFRKSNVLPKTAKDFDATKQLCRRDFRYFDRDRGAVITVR